MSLNGAGVYNVNSAGQPVVSTTLITAAAFNAFTADIATALSSAVFKDGQQTITANIPMAGFTFTGIGSGNAARDRAARTGDVQDNLANWGGTAGGTAGRRGLSGARGYSPRINRPERMASGRASLSGGIRSQRPIPLLGFIASRPAF